MRSCRFLRSYKWSGRIDLFASFVDDLEAMALEKPAPISINEMLWTSRRFADQPHTIWRNANHVRQEVSIRLAHQIRSFQALPYVVAVDPHVHAVYLECWNAYVQLRQLPDVTDADVHVCFAQGLDSLLQSQTGAHVLQRLAVGVKSVRHLRSVDVGDMTFVDRFLSRFTKQRVAWQIIAKNHMNLATKGEGVFNKETKPGLIAEAVSNHVSELCLTRYGSAPEIQISGDVNCTFQYLDDHVQYVFSEVLKNAMRATIEKHPTSSLPPINIDICEGENVSVKIRDQGGGVPEQWAQDIWRFGWTSARDDEASSSKRPSHPHHYFPGYQSQEGVDEAFLAAPPELEELEMKLSGYGFGLPLSRCFVENFGGTLQMVSLPGYGCDMIITFPSLGSEAITLR